MFALFTGIRVFDGIEPTALFVDGAQAEEAAIKVTADGKFAEAVEVQDPAAQNKNYSADAEGRVLVVFSGGLSSGATVFGPFAEFDDAMEFAEDQRGEDEEYEIFTIGVESDTVDGERYLHGCWQHIFTGKTVSYVRFVFDCEENRMVKGQVQGTLGWSDLDIVSLADLEDSLKNANDAAFEDHADYGLERTADLPDWVV